MGGRCKKTAAVILSSFLLSSPSRFFSRILSIGGKQPLPCPSAAGGRAALTASPFRHWCPVVWYACRTHAAFLHLSARAARLPFSMTAWCVRCADTLPLSFRGRYRQAAGVTPFSGSCCPRTQALGCKCNLSRRVRSMPRAVFRLCLLLLCMPSLPSGDAQETTTTVADQAPQASRHSFAVEVSWTEAYKYCLENFDDLVLCESTSRC